MADPPPEEVARLTARRDNARWTAVVGFLMMFGGGVMAALAFGGAAMVLYGSAASVYWGRRLRRLKGDPWAYDPDLDGPEGLEWRRR